jgi:hypothetical protein
MITNAQRRALLEALGSPDLRIPVDFVRQHATRMALTGASWAGDRWTFADDAWMRQEEEDGRVYLRLTRAGAAQLGAACLKDFEDKEPERFHEEVDSYAPGGRWHNQDARLAFSSAYAQARFRGLSAGAAQAIFQNVVAAVAHELRSRLTN